MLNKEIYKGVLGLLAESADDLQTEDYAERAPYILANFISENAALDANYRQFHGEEAARVAPLAYVSLDGVFPLSARFVSAAEYYLAAQLIEYEDSDRSDDFFDRYCKALSDIWMEIPAMREKILNVYG